MDAQDQAALDGFMLAIRVMYHTYNIEAPGTEYEKPWVLLREIAEGHVTLANPGDMAAKFPHMRDFLFDRANLVVDRDREMAQSILRGLQEAF